jgi:hypothetical protein
VTESRADSCSPSLQNGIIPSNHDTYDNIEWDGLAAQFMLGSTSTAPPTTDDQHLPHF